MKRTVTFPYALFPYLFVPNRIDDLAFVVHSERGLIMKNRLWLGDVLFTETPLYLALLGCSSEMNSST